MIETFANFLFYALSAYAAAGVVVAVLLHAGGLVRIDPAVKGAGWWFRTLITPGLVALWPWMLMRRRGSAKGAVDRPFSAAGLRRAHLGLAVALALLVPILVVLGLVLRPGAVERTDDLKVFEASMPGGED